MRRASGPEAVFQQGSKEGVINPTLRPHSSSFLWFICRILEGNPKQELLWGLRVNLKGLKLPRPRFQTFQAPTSQRLKPWALNPGILIHLLYTLYRLFRNLGAQTRQLNRLGSDPSYLEGQGDLVSRL